MKIASLLLLLVVQVDLSFAHPYKLDSYGCHNNSKLSIYECHEGDFAGKSWANPGGKNAMLQARAALLAKPFTEWKGTATLTWNPNDPKDQVLGYKVYWSLDPSVEKWNGPIDAGNTTSIRFDGILRGATYHFYVTAYNSIAESPRSNIVNKEFK